MPFLIDGHNLIPKIPGLSLNIPDDEEALVRLLQDFCRQNRKKVEVYFDNAPPGQPRKRNFGMVTAHFVSQGSSADAAIRARLRNLGAAARNWVVVTSDREIAAASRESRARVIPAEEFARTLAARGPTGETPPEKDENISLDQESVEDWLAIFDQQPGSRAHTPVTRNRR